MKTSSNENVTEKSELARLIEKRINELAYLKNQADIAREIGYDKPNMISMFKTGKAKIPIEKSYLLARSLQVDPALVLRLALEQSVVDSASRDTINKIIGTIVTDNEVEIVKAIREFTGGKNPQLTADQREQMKNIFTKAGS